jgi:hypothetical protein
MTEDFELENLKYPHVVAVLFFGTAILGYWRFYLIQQYFFRYLVQKTSFDFLGWIVAFFLYLIPLSIGALLLRFKNTFLQLIAFCFIGIALGAIFRFALGFVGILNPYNWMSQ